MPKVLLYNSRLDPVTNEVKIGEDVDGSCDSRLKHLGTFTLQPGQSQTVANVTDTTEVYWKNVKEYYWTHKTAWHFDAATRLDVSTAEDDDNPVDVWGVTEE